MKSWLLFSRNIAVWRRIAFSFPAPTGAGWKPFLRCERRWGYLWYRATRHASTVYGISWNGIRRASRPWSRSLEVEALIPVARSRGWSQREQVGVCPQLDFQTASLLTGPPLVTAAPQLGFRREYPDTAGGYNYVFPGCDR